MVWTTPKTFTAGERLFAQDLNTYVSDNLADLDPRTVKSFADASARTTAIPSPAAGAVTFLEDTDAVEVYDGSAWTSVNHAGIGSNVASSVSTAVFTTTSTSFTDLTGLSVTITPSSATSKVLLIAQVSVGLGNTASFGHYKFSGGNTATYLGVDPGSREPVVFGGYTDANNSFALMSFSMVYLDSPATTSATTYKVELKSPPGTTIYVNRAAGETTGSPRGASSLTAVEVAA